MMVRADQAQRGKVYRRPRHETRGRWMEVPAFDGPTLLGRLARRKRPTAGDMAMLWRLKGQVNLVPMRVHLRGIDPLTCDHYEATWLVLVSPATQLREVSRRPGYGGGM